jgi:hypothetical protein
MKWLTIAAIITLSVTYFSCTNGDSTKNKGVNENSVNKIEVFDFHSTHRCMTCNAIESSTKYTLDKYFAEELKSGLITFTVVNVDNRETRKITEKFEAAGTALILNVIVNGVETKIDLTNFAFMKGNEQEEFAKEFKLKIENELKKM